MSLFLQAQSTTGRPGPERALQILGRFRWNGNPAFLLSLEAELSFQNRLISERVSSQSQSLSASALMQSGFEYDDAFLTPLSGEAIRYIEDQRGDADLIFSLEIYYRWQEALSLEGQQPFSVAGAVHWDQRTSSVRIARSDWLQRLKEMEWEETQIFEVAVLPPNQHPDLTEAIRLLGEAQGALRAHDLKGVLVKCREALESAAKHAARSNNLLQGFELLLAQAFPDESAKIAALTDTIHVLSKYMHTFGRHAQYPPVQPSYGEGHFVFATTTAFFSRLSRRLAGKETV